MGNKITSLGVNAGANTDLKIDRTVIAAQTTPTAIKLGGGNLYGIYAMMSGSAATSGAFIQYFSHGGTTLGVSTPDFEVHLPAAMATALSSSAYFNFPIGIPITSNATTSGIWIAAGIAASTGTNVAANVVTVYTLYS